MIKDGQVIDIKFDGCTDAKANVTREFAKLLARALARPGHELQQRLVTAEPSPEQIEVANAALEECLRLESAADGGGDGTAEEAPPA